MSLFVYSVLVALNNPQKKLSTVFTEIRDCVTSVESRSNENYSQFCGKSRVTGTLSLEGCVVDHFYVNHRQQKSQRQIQRI